MTEIYLTHHVRNAESLSKMTGSPDELAENVFNAERKAKKELPKDPEAYKKAISASIDAVRKGKNLENLGIDFPGTGFETDPICNVCRVCIMRDRDEVEYFYEQIKAKNK